LIQVGFKNLVHEIHECCWGISEAKGHHHKLVVSVLGVEGSLGYIYILDLKLVVS